MWLHANSFEMLSCARQYLDSIKARCAASITLKNLKLNLDLLVLVCDQTSLLDRDI